ncbi:hypothetical protein [Aurantimonas sp. Leaf443]|uniref:hypothetical protein n=1 Tax=Aurantimonas sp. Leaf443 TaxID=1736378 RepID=UPI000701EEBB|nr:hypothetical protein [Aurantimonas sp. Leaf443]KQT83797.1 hypothetical protein ASG48_10330 [Aurantimonas sp. Leaf443]
MPAKTYFIAQGFQKSGRKLVPVSPNQFRTAEQAVARAGRDGERYAGAVAFQQIADEETGELLEEPTILARFGELPAEFGS